MKKFLKGIAIALALALVVTPCAVLFAGCGAKEYTAEGRFRYVEIANDSSYVDDEYYEFVEEVKEGDTVVGKIYKYTDRYYGGSQGYKFVIVDEDTAEFHVFGHAKEGPCEQDYIDRIFFSYEKYNGVYLCSIGGGNYIENYIVEVEDEKLIGIKNLWVSSVEDAKEEIDAYIASEKSFVVYFDENISLY